MEALSHFSLAELDDFRKVSPTFHSACNRRKQFIHNCLSKGNSVEIVNLTSKKGMEINGRLAIIDSKVGTNGRYPVKIHHLTREVERMSIKPQNLNPFLKKEHEFFESNRFKFINYSSDAKIREGHGRLLDQVLMLLRYAINEMNGRSFFKGDFQSFMNLDRSDQRVAAANAQVFTMYRVKTLFGKLQDLPRK